MARPMKVFSWMGHDARGLPIPEGREHVRQTRHLVAATTKKAALEAADLTPGEARGMNFGETWNDGDVATGLRNPGRVLVQPLDQHDRHQWYYYDTKAPAPVTYAERLIVDGHEYTMAVTLTDGEHHVTFRRGDRILYEFEGKPGGDA